MGYKPNEAFDDAITRLKITTSHRELLYNLPVLLLGVNEEGVIKYINRLWEIKLGYTPNEMLGKNFMDFVIENDEEDTQKEFEDVNANEEYDELFINRYRCKDGSIVEIEWASMSIYSTLLTWGAGTIRKRIPKEEVYNG